MKKLFLLAVGLAMTLTACQKDEGLVSDGATSQTITVTAGHLVPADFQLFII